MKRPKKILSSVLIMIMIFSLMPENFQSAYGYDQSSYIVEEIVIGKEHDSGRFTTGMSISIKGRDLESAPVFIEYGSKYEQLANPKIDTYGLLYFEFTNPQDWEKLKNLKSIIIGNASIPIGDRGAMPTITDVTPKVKKDDTLYLKGTNFKLIESGDVVVKYGTGLLFNTIEDSDIKVYPDENTAEVTGFEMAELGLQDIEITRNFEIDSVYFNEQNPDVKVNVSIIHTYNGQFRLTEDLNISDDIEMFPNRGASGSKVYFKASELRQYDVYFLKATDGTDPYTIENKGKNPSPLQQNDNGLYVFTVEVPDIAPGEYWVVLTNRVSDDKDPMQAVSGEYIYTKEKFTVIQGAKSAVIDAIQPSSGPDTGSIATITGRYLGSLNIDDLVIYENFQAPQESISGDGVLTLRYEDANNGEIGKYRNASVTLVKKSVKVIIGPQAHVQDSSNFSPDIDRLVVRINPDTKEDDPVKDVIVETTTVIETQDGKIYTFTERAELPGGYTFISSRIKPEVESVVPNEIYVIKKDGADEYVVPEDIMVSIYGKNFTVYKYVDDEEIKVSYPVVSFGSSNDIVIDKSDGIEFYVMDDQNNILDGTPGNEIGNKILIVIPEGTKVPEEYVESSVPVIVTNPVRNSSEPGLSSEDTVMVKFLLLKEDKTPVIESITPDTVTVDGGETVTIRGSNFLQDVKVIIDGREVSDIIRSGDGKTITFTAPSGREGVTQLQVINPNGGIAVKDFYYVKTYTDPKIEYFSPKAGNTGTLVMVKGDNFLLPDPTASSNEIYKLIGTRILLQNRDINEYNIDPATKRIKLQYYVSPQKEVAGKLIRDEILQIEESTDGSRYLKMADYWHSIIFTDSSGKFYALRQDAQGNAILTDGVSSTYEFFVKSDNGEYKIFASKEGASDYPVYITVEEIDGAQVSKLVIEESPKISLYMQTLYRVDDQGFIVGNNVKVIDKNTILFKVPVLTLGDGYYDLTVLNPDTKKDSRTGEQGFYYYTMPQSKPEIHQIVPNKGSTDGGYTIDIIGSNFVDDGTYKTRVFINGVEVEREHVFVSVDGNSITVKVPPYTGDISKELETDRISVPVVVLNPDGASAGLERGFTYVVPTSHPEITKIVPVQGSAAGKQIVEITGKDFRYFEPYNDDNRNQIKDPEEPFTDINGNGVWDDFRLTNVREKLGEEYDDSKDLIENLKDYYGENFEDTVLSVLPKVYFGSAAAQIMEFSDGYIKVSTPAGSAGDVDVYVVNNDSGISNKVKYTYTSSNPIISRIVPSEGKKQGKDKVEVFGSNFIESEITVVKPDGNREETQMVQIRFGNVTNLDIPRDEENSGRIDNQRTTVNLSGGLKVEYANGRVNISITEKGQEYVTVDPIYFDGSPLFVSTKLLKADGSDPYPYEELIRLEIKDRRLYVERGYAPDVEYLNHGQLVVTTPAYYTIGEVEVLLINPDGGVAKGAFTYKYPDSHPYIVNITKEGQSPVDQTINGREVKILTMTYKGGNIVSVIGGDFRENAKIQISDVATINPEQITYMLPTKLTFTMPEVPEDALGKLHRVVVINEDGGTASSDQVSPRPIYIMFVKGETAPAVSAVVPDRGPATGGTKVTIEGRDFREGLKVYFGETVVPEENIQVVDYKTIIAVTPPHAPGTVEVKVENPDGELSNPNGTFTYLSSPSISAVVDPEDLSETERISRISVEGGEKIKIKGSSFMEGARVVFAPVIKMADEEEDADIVIYIDGKPYVLEEGTDGLDVSYIDTETLTVVTPPGKLGSSGVIVINPDGGASRVYDQLIYGLPELEAPEDVIAELLYDRFIKVSWSAVEDAEGYEIYAVVDEAVEFVGSTEFTSFVYKDLESNTRYRFIVKALGPFGSSPPSAMSNSVKTGSRVGPEDEDEGLVENTAQERVADTVKVVIGTDDYKNDITINLNDGDYIGADKVVITIPSEVIARTNAGDITIISSDFTLKFNPKVFNSSRVSRYGKQNDAGVRFEVTKDTGSKNTNMISLSERYALKAKFYTGPEDFQIDYLSSPMELSMDIDKGKANLHRLNNAALCRFDEYSGSWQKIYETNNSDRISIRTTVERLGVYGIFGTRR